MADQSLSFVVTFDDFRFLQRHLAIRVFGKDKAAHVAALLGVVICAVFLAAALVVVSQSYRLYRMTLLGLNYPSSLYFLVIVILIAAIGSLLPAIKLRLKTLRMQVSDDGPLLGATKLTIEDDGLRIDRPAVTAKYFWAAFQGVEIVKGAVILPVDNGIGLIVPKAAFASEAARLEFSAEIARRLENARRAA